MDWLRDHLWETWLAVGIVLALAELLSLDLFLLMLGVGALGGMATALVTDNVVAQVLVASAVSVAMLGLVRPTLVRRLHGGPELVLGPASLVGRQGVVTQEIAEHAPGRIRIDGETWQAESADNEALIGIGRTVEIVEIRGATAYVHPVAEGAS
ncbi:MAG TPA: NfeD family protein [Nocardioides sp.]|nr:NfeD family protein [Nocardioides sp.]